LQQCAESVSQAGEELQGNTVGVAKTQSRPVRRIHDAAVRDAQLAQPRDPILQLAAAGAAEADVIQADPQLAEFLAGGWAVMLMDAEDRAAIQQPHKMPEAGLGVLVEHGSAPKGGDTRVR